jgi:PAS domain S-box-containing protein
VARVRKKPDRQAGHDAPAQRAADSRRNILDVSVLKPPPGAGVARPLPDQEMLWPDIPFHAIVEQSLVGIYVLQDECFQYVNATFAGMIGRTPEEMLGVHLNQFVVPEFLGEVMSLYNKRISGELPSVRFVTRLVHRHGGEVKIEVHGSRMFYRGRPAVVGVGIDVTERLKRDEELRQSRAQLQELAAHINTVREEQRAKFARELHDVLGGMLTSIKMDVTRIARRAQTPELAGITSDLLALTQETIDTVRKISDELRPSVLDHLGLAAAIERELTLFAARHNMESALDTDGMVLRLGRERSTAIYRILQEALTNIARHAAATRVTVHLGWGEQALRMEVIDNGRGIDVAVNRIGSLGILSMTERARELGGTLDIGPHAAGGTRLSLMVPYE